jgi:hypothetical protein
MNEKFQATQHVDEWKQLCGVLRKWPRRLDSIRREVVAEVTQHEIEDGLGTIDNSGEDEEYVS